MGKRTAVVVVGFVVALGAACGGGGSSAQKVTVAPTAAALKQSAAATLSKGPMHVDMTMHTTIQGKDVTLQGTGGVDPAQHHMFLSFDAKDLFNTLAAGESLPPGASEALDKPLEVMLDGAVMYMHFPLLAVVTGGKEWFKVDLAQGNSAASDLFGGAGAGGFGNDPSAMLQFLEGTGKVTEVGTEDVRGVSTRHFSGTYTLDDALAAAKPEDRDRLERAYKGLGLPDSARSQKIPFDVWIGEDGLVRRMGLTMDFSKFVPSSGAVALPGAIDITMEFFDFGKPIEFNLPSDDEVQDFSSLFSNATSKFNTVASSIN